MHLDASLGAVWSQKYQEDWKWLGLEPVIKLAASADFLGFAGDRPNPVVRMPSRRPGAPLQILGRLS